MTNKTGQTSVVYMSLFVLLGIVFLSFVFILSDNFSKNSAEEISGYIAENIFARIEKASLELRAIENQTSPENLTKTISIPRRLGENTYQIIGKDRTIIFLSAGRTSIYETKTIHWQDISFEGSTDSQNAEINLKLNATANTIRLY